MTDRWLYAFNGSGAVAWTPDDKAFYWSDGGGAWAWRDGNDLYAYKDGHRLGYFDGDHFHSPDGQPLYYFG